MDARNLLLLVVVVGVVSAGCAAGSQNIRANDARGDTVPPVDSTADGFSLNVFRNIVRSKVIDAFTRMSEGDASGALALMREDVKYRFEGDHALGGERVSRAGVEKWFGRLFR